MQIASAITISLEYRGLAPFLRNLYADLDCKYLLGRSVVVNTPILYAKIIKPGHADLQKNIPPQFHHSVFV